MDNEDKMQQEENDVELSFKQFLGTLNEPPTINLESRIQSKILNCSIDKDFIESEHEIQEENPLQFYFKQCDMDDEDNIQEKKDVELYFKEFLCKLNELPTTDLKSRIENEILSISFDKDDLDSEDETQEEDSMKFYFKQCDVDNQEQPQEGNDVELYFKQFLGKLNEFSTVGAKSRDLVIQKTKENIPSSLPSPCKTSASCLTIENQQKKAINIEEILCNSPSKLLSLDSDSIPNFPTNKAKLAKSLFDMFNEKVFDNQLPKDMPLLWCNRLRSTAGTTLCTCKGGEYKSVITLSLKIITSLDRLRDTLLHEMCHAAVWVINKMGNIDHGPLWKIWAARCKLILPQIDLPLRCHNYELSYTYKFGCYTCKWEHGRFKRLPSLLKKICKKCKGPIYMIRNN